MSVMKIKINHSGLAILHFVIAWTFFLCGISHAASFSINPVKVFLENGAKTTTLSITNNSNEDLSLNINAYLWSQDAEGNDVLNETNDITFFPRQMTLKKDEGRFIRIGIKTPANISERTYRFIIEEVPNRKEIEQGVAVKMLMKASVPLFVLPAKRELRGEIQDISVANNGLNIKILNSGNVHFTVTSVNISGKNAAGDEVFSRDIGGWYILSNNSAAYKTTIPQDLCHVITQINVNVKSEDISMRKEILMDNKSFCSQ